MRRNNFEDDYVTFARAFSRRKVGRGWPRLP